MIECWPGREGGLAWYRVSCEVCGSSVSGSTDADATEFLKRSGYTLGQVPGDTRCPTCRNRVIPSETAKPAAGDPVNPSHYRRGGIELIEVIEAWDLDHHRASALQYIVRAGIKDPSTTVEDLLKARWYIERAINRLEGKK